MFMIKGLPDSIKINLILGMAGLEKYFDFIPPGVAELWNYSKEIQVPYIFSEQIHIDFKNILLIKIQDHAFLTLNDILCLA